MVKVGLNQQVFILISTKFNRPLTKFRPYYITSLVMREFNVLNFNFVSALLLFSKKGFLSASSIYRK